MRKLLLILILFPFFFLQTTTVFAQDTSSDSKMEESLEEKIVNDPEVSIEILEEKAEDTVIPEQSFVTILLALVIPSVLIVICYMILKYFKF